MVKPAIQTKDFKAVALGVLNTVGVKVNALNLDPLGVPGDTTIGSSESIVSDAIESHHLVELSVSLAQSDGQVVDVYQVLGYCLVRFCGGRILTVASHSTTASRAGVALVAGVQVLQGRVES